MAYGKHPERVRADEERREAEMSVIEGAESIAYDADEVSARCDQLLDACPPATTASEMFLGAQFDAGLAFVQYPVGMGGLGLQPSFQALVDDRLRAAGAPDPFSRNPIGWRMGFPTIATHGTDAQRQRYLRPIFAGEEVWCQLFSEPGAGSDVAGLATRAVRDGDEWLVNGQKVWTSYAHRARWGMLVARTDPDVPKHKGLTYFVIDMHQPGVDVRPLRQMTGDAEFNEVYLADAGVPDTQRLGEVGEGWRIALTTLMNERVSIGGIIEERGSGVIDEAVRLYSANRDGDPDRQAVLRDRLTSLWIHAEVVRLTNLRAAAARRGGVPGPEGSVSRLIATENRQAIYAFCVDLLGATGMQYDIDAPLDPYGASPDVGKSFLRSRANSIEGGTSEVLRNILGERSLGLPSDVRVDKDLPWSNVPR
jgi:alkylation response protein AidB-like acyl-CoA dehydrogenase